MHKVWLNIKYNIIYSIFKILKKIECLNNTILSLNKYVFKNIFAYNKYINFKLKITKICYLV